MPANTVKSNTIQSLIWKFLERGSTQILQFIVTIILARILEPEAYGVVALVLIVINLLNVFVQSGLNSALIRKKEADLVDFSTVFYTSLFLAGVLYVILFFAAPYIETFYKMPEISTMLRVLGLSLFFGALNSIQVAEVSRNFKFKKLFFSGLVGVVVSAAVAIFLAYRGAGAWALIWQNLISVTLNCFVMWFTVKWRPIFKFSFTKLKTLFSFGWKLLVSGLIDTLYKDIRSLIIGKKFNSESLAFYNRGKQFPEIIVGNVNSTINSVMFVTYSKAQDDIVLLKSMVKRAMTVSAYLVFPCLAGLAVVAEPLVLILLGKKWLFSVPYLRIACFTFAFYPIITANLQAINALGRSDVFLKLEIAKKIVGIMVLVASVVFFDSVYIIAVGGAVTSIVCFFINTYPGKSLLNYSIFEQVKDLSKIVLINLLMMCVVYLIGFYFVNIYIKIIVQMTSGVLLYIILSVIFKIDSFNYIKEELKQYKKGKTR